MRRLSRVVLLTLVWGVVAMLVGFAVTDPGNYDPPAVLSPPAVPPLTAGRCCYYEAKSRGDTVILDVRDTIISTAERDRLEAAAAELERRNALDFAYYRALAREGLVPVTTHEPAR